LGVDGNGFVGEEEGALGWASGERFNYDAVAINIPHD